MYKNLAHNVLSFQNGVIRIRLNGLNCTRIELIKNEIIHIIEYPNGNGGQSTVLTLEKLKSLRDDFIDHVEIDRDLKESSITGYKSRTRLFIKWLEENNIDKVSMDHWREYYSQLKRSKLTDTTVRNYFRDLNGFAGWLALKGHLPSNPLDGITPPAATKESIQSKAIPKKDIDIMIKHAITTRDRAIFIFFRDTACRGSEAAAMQWENVDFDQGKAYVIGKGGKLRTLRFKSPTAKTLREYQYTLKEYQDM